MIYTEQQLKRFWSKVNKTEGCWLWTGSTYRGYGEISLENVDMRVHRVSLQIHLNQKLEGLHVHHKCGNKSCVNPDHLEAITEKEHVMKPDSCGGMYALKTHCPKGHPYSGDNLYVIKNHHCNNRYCRQCKKDWLKANRWRYKKK